MTVRERMRRRAKTRSRALDERGMTLVEMLIGLMITGIIMAALFSAALFFIQHSMEAEAQLADDSAVQLLNTLFTADAQSAQTVTKADAAPCLGNELPDPGTALVSFGWNDAGRTEEASWFVTTTFQNRVVLQRRKCIDGTVINATDVDGVQSGTVTVVCTPDCATPASVSISGTATNGAPFSAAGVLRTESS